MESQAARNNQSNYIIGIDTGGTFTDVTVLLPDGETIINKAATTPGDFSSGVMNALQVTAESMGMDRATLLRQSSVFKHGTTVATNAMITRTGSKVGLLTTKGHEDAIFIMRAVGRVDGLDEMEIRHVTKVTKPEPLVQRSDVRGIFERLDFRGDVLAPLDEDDAREAIRYLVEERFVDAIAICLLFGWKNPVHEKRIVELIGEMYHNRDLTVTASHAIAPMSGEYARINTTVANSFLDRTMRGYVDALRRRLHSEGLRDGGVMLMQGNGGIVRPEEMTAVGSLQSGPAGGMIATEYIAGKLGHDNVITTDMGGTSFDVGVLTLGALHYARAPIVERARLLQPLIQVESIGAGGGTIAGVDPLTRRLLVGPASAGADPGPVAYGMGGKSVTVTDANIILGYINPDYFLGGRRKLDSEAAEKAIASLDSRAARALHCRGGGRHLRCRQQQDVRPDPQAGRALRHHARGLRHVRFRRRRSGSCRGLRGRPWREEDIRLPGQPRLLCVRRGDGQCNSHKVADELFPGADRCRCSRSRTRGGGHGTGRSYGARGLRKIRTSRSAAPCICGTLVRPTTSNFRSRTDL